MANLLIIDDEKKLCDLLARILQLENYNVFKAYTGSEGLNILRQQDIDVILCDVKLPDYNGIELVEIIKQQKPFVQIINLTAYGTIADGVKAMKNGAYDYLTKGDDNEKIIPLVAQAVVASKATRDKFEQENTLSPSNDAFANVIGTSAPVQHAVALAKRVATTSANVLLLGETGTGKEVFAKAIHQASRVANKKFVAINCSAISAELLESELFGYKKGAFTGALADKKGLVEIADGGTLFLDEIGEMPLHMQAKILRVLEDGTFIKLGDAATKQVQVRIIAATNRNLDDEIVKGNFREDLFYRLSVFTINLPSLNQRREDIKLLITHFLKKLGNQNYQLTPAFLKLMQEHSWKGNIRELKNTIERAVILAENEILDQQLLPINFKSSSSNLPSFEMDVIEAQHIKKVLTHTLGNKTEAAKLLGIGIATLYRKIEQYGL